MPEDITSSADGDVAVDPNDAKDTSEALDALLQGTDETTAIAAPKAEDAVPKVEDVVPKAEDAVPKVDDVVPKAEPKVDAAPAPVKDELDGIELPPHVKPKTVEAWSKLKDTAKRKITELSAAADTAKAEAEAARKERDELKQSSLSSEEQKELAQLREFRQKIDVEADPSFREFDTKISENVAAIYSRLGRSGFSKESIDKIKTLGGPDKVNWEPLRDKLTPELLRYLDAKLVENEDLGEKKGIAISKAKETSSEFLKSRQTELAKSGSGFKAEVQKEFEALSPKLPWLKSVEIPKDAKPEVRAQLEASNAAVKEIQADIKEAIEDNSPTMRAVLVAGYATMLRLQVEAKSRGAEHKAEVDKLKSENAKLQGTLKEKETFIEKIKGSSTGRLSKSSAPDGKSHTKTQPGDPFESGNSALDRIRQELEAANAE